MNSTLKTQLALAVGGVLSVVAVYVTREALLPFFIAFLLAYFLDPLLDWMESKKVPRTVAISLLLVFVFGVVLIAALLIYPPLERQVAGAIKHLPEYAKKVEDKLAPVVEKLSGYDKEEVEKIINAAVEKMGSLPMQILTAVYGFAVSTISSVAGMVSMLFGFIIIPVAAFYFMRDIDEMRQKLLLLVPERYREKTTEVFRDVDRVLSSFVRGQLTVALAMAFMLALGLYLIGTPMGLFIGILGGLANIVPYLALVVGLLPAMILTYLHFGDFTHILYVLILFGAVQFVEGFFLTPRIMGKSLGLSPVVIMLAVLIGGLFFGIVGIILAVPAAAVIKVILTHLGQSYRASSFYRQKGKE